MGNYEYDLVNIQDIPTTPDTLRAAANAAGSELRQLTEAAIHLGQQSLWFGFAGAGFLPDNLQTQEYKAKLMESQNKSPIDIAQAISLHAGRAALLQANDVEQLYVIDQRSLEPLTPGPDDVPRMGKDVMLRQLGHLLELTEENPRLSLTITGNMRGLLGLNVDYLYQEPSPTNPPTLVHVQTELTTVVAAPGESVPSLIDQILTIHPVVQPNKVRAVIEKQRDRL